MIGETIIQLSQLMMSEKQTIQKKLYNLQESDKVRGKIKIQADAIKKTEDIIKFQITANLQSRKFLCFGEDNPYLMIERGKIEQPGEWMRVFKTEFKYDEVNPWWDAYQMSMTNFCNNNKTLPIRISVRSYRNAGNHPFYGTVVTTTREIEMAPGNQIEIKDKNGKVQGTLKFNRFELDMRRGLVEYLSEGWQMEVHVGIDFTLSNLEISDYRSLHRQGDTGVMNQYEKAIFEVCNVMMPYARRRKFYAYGFGAVPTYLGMNEIQRVWNLKKGNGKVDGTLGVLEQYYKAINGSILAGPTYFADLFNKIKLQIMDNMMQNGKDNKIYHVVIIITDGCCHDMEATKKILVEMSSMPFSAVIVGVGTGDFEQMEELDADEKVLTDADGNEALRDIVQLVKYEDFKDLGMRELAFEVLGEVPDQFVDYQVMKE